MRFNIATCFLGLVLALSLSACTDHRLGGTLSPVRLRLKTVQGGSLNSTYSYDSQSRLVGITKADGSLNVISYGDPTNKYVNTAAEANNIFYVNYPNPADQTSGEITRYPYPGVTDGTDFEAITYPLLNSQLYYSIRIRRIGYTFNASKRLTSVEYRGDGPNLNTYSYEYTGENVTTQGSVIAAGHGGTYVSTFTYDDKINPYFGVLDPAVDNLLRVNRNNIVKEIFSQYGTILQTYTYEYEYNQQGLPTKRVKKRNDVVIETLNFGYEAY